MLAQTKLQTQAQAVVTRGDLGRLQDMAASLREALPASGEPYGSYLRALERRLARMAVVPAGEVGGDVVTMNASVRVRDLDSSCCQTLTLVYEADADPFGERVSVLTPLGVSLLGSRAGDVVEWPTRRGPRRLRVEAIVFQPEAAGEFGL